MNSSRKLIDAIPGKNQSVTWLRRLYFPPSDVKKGKTSFYHLFHYRENERQRQCRLFQEIVHTRKKVLLPSSNDTIQQNFSQDSTKHTGSEFNHKVAKRYFEELNMIRQEAGESGNSSEDENFPGIASKIMSFSLQGLTLNFNYYLKRPNHFIILRWSTVKNIYPQKRRYWSDLLWICQNYT